ANANLQYVRTADGTLLDAAGNVLDPALVSATPDFVNFSRALLPRYFSSDARLGAYGVVSGGLGLQYRFGNGLRLDAGIDYYRRASSLQFDGEGDTPYADYHYVSASLALSYDWQQASATHHHHHDAESGTTNDELLPPAAVQFVHDAMPAGSVMAGYQLMMDNPDMTMHMLDLHYAVDDRWSLMLMPQFMTMRHVHDAAAAAASVHAHHGSGSHLIGMPQLLAASNWSWPAGTEGHWQLTAGMGVPVTGSDAWSAQPALAYWRQRGDWQWGAQLRSQDDLQQRQADSHEPAHATEQNLWLSTTLVGSLAATLHAMHDDRRYVDVGTYHTYSLGVGVGMPLLGNPLRLEWLQPVSAHDPTDPRPGGGSLVLQWQLALH
ncbi:MAG TPA: DUF3570 domain-containing protein, partial [Candidatus Acidoferrum sp.]|nr:DUF3570 domain-containing protein [Candidatus Acidoferrum sp.]